MRKILSCSVLAPLLAAAFLAGCGPEYYPGDRYPDGAYGRYGEPGGVRGTVESVNPRERLIYLDEENGDRDEGPIVLSYDDGTAVRYQGQTFRPESLERGDRIQVSVDRDDDGRLLAESIDVLYDVSQGGPPGGYDDRRRGDDRNGGGLQGIIRSIDTGAQTLEIERSGGPGDTVEVGYDARTPVRYQGSLYSPDNLERGDEVRIRVHDYDGRLFAQEIVVVRDRRSRG
jgi:Domain of unknown function (DUF5666)